MFELYKGELLRLRKGAIVCLLGLITLYYMMPKIGFWDILHRNMGFLLIIGSVFLSLAFGILHGLLWRKKNFWVFLIHRPLAPRKIYTSLMGAGVTVIVATIFASIFATTLAYDALTDKVVVSRHYAYAFYVTLLSMACYMLGTLTILHRSKFVIIGFYTLAMVFFPHPQNMIAMYLPLLLMIAVLFYLNLQCFKPDLNQPVSSPFATMLLGAGTSYGLSIGLVLATLLFYHLPLSVMGKHPDMNPPAGSMKVMWLDNFKNGIGYVLENSEHPQAAHYARQASLAKRRNLPIKQWQPPRKNQIHRFDNSDALYNPNNGDIWKFSHDHMVLIGVSAQNGQRIGAIGRNGLVEELSALTDSDRFVDVPHLSGGEFLSTEHGLYALDFDTNSLLLKHRPDEGEKYTSSLWAGENAALISTNRQLYLFDIATLLDDYSDLTVDHSITYPDQVEQAEFGYGLPVADGFILLFFGDHFYGFDRPGAEVFVTRLDGSFEFIGGREFTAHDHPSWIRHYNFMVAPFINTTEDLIMHAIDPYDDRFLSWSAFQQQEYPTSIYAIAALLQIIGVVGIVLLARRSTLNVEQRRTWVGLGVVLGLPALLSYLLLNPIRQP